MCVFDKCTDILLMTEEVLIMSSDKCADVLQMPEQM